MCLLVKKYFKNIFQQFGPRKLSFIHSNVTLPEPSHKLISNSLVWQDYLPMYLVSRKVEQMGAIYSQRKYVFH